MYETGPGEAIAIGRGGWLYWRVPPYHNDVRLKVARNDMGRRVTNVLLVGAHDTLFGAGSIAPTQLRDLTIGRIEEILNAPGYAELIDNALEAADGPDYSPGALELGTAYGALRD